MLVGDRIVDDTRGLHPVGGSVPVEQLGTAEEGAAPRAGPIDAGGRDVFDP